MGTANPNSPPATPPAWKHPLYYPDFAWKVCIAIAAAVWAVSSFYQRKTNDEMLLEIQRVNNATLLDRQIQNQNKVADDQRELAEKQLAAGLLARFKCDGSARQTIEFLFLQTASPTQATNISNALVECSHRPEDRRKAAEDSLQSQFRELDQQFLDRLSVARQFRRVGLQNQAASEYEKAYNQLPQARRNSLDESIARKARQALENRDFPAASDLFEQFFSPIGTP